MSKHKALFERFSGPETKPVRVERLPNPVIDKSKLCDCGIKAPGHTLDYHESVTEPLKAVVLIVVLLGALRIAGAQPRPIVATGCHEFMVRHGYGSYIHDEDAAKAVLLARANMKLDPDFSPHVMDDPGNRRQPEDWCERVREALNRRPAHPQMPAQAQGQGQHGAP